MGKISEVRNKKDHGRFFLFSFGWFIAPCWSAPETRLDMRTKVMDGKDLALQLRVRGPRFETKKGSRGGAGLPFAVLGNGGHIKAHDTS